MGIEVLLILVLIAFNGVLAMSEMALVSARKARLRQRAEAGDAASEAALRLSEEPTRFLSTVQIGITLVGIFAGAFGGATVARPLGAALATIPVLAPYADAISLAVVVAIITYLSLIFGELVPKRLALNNADSLAALVARPMQHLSTATGPLVSLLTFSTDGVLRLLGVRPSADATVTEDDVRSMLAEGAQAGVFERAEREIVESAFELGDTQIRELMTPRLLIDWIDVEDPPEAVWAEVAAASRHYYPVCRGDLDNVVGVLSARDLLNRLLLDQQPDLTRMVREPLFLPEHLPAFKALERFTRDAPRVALVIDEHGGIAGLLAPGDILGALVGDVAEPNAAERNGAVRREDGSWLLDGLMQLDDLADLFDLPEDEEPGEIQTVGGLAMAVLGRIPEPGDRFTWRGIHFEVLDLDGRRVDKVLASAHPARDQEPPRSTV